MRHYESADRHRSARHSPNGTPPRPRLCGPAVRAQQEESPPRRYISPLSHPSTHNSRHSAVTAPICQANARTAPHRNPNPVHRLPHRRRPAPPTLFLTDPCRHLPYPNLQKGTPLELRYGKIVSDTTPRCALVFPPLLLGPSAPWGPSAQAAPRPLRTLGDAGWRCVVVVRGHATLVVFLGRRLLHAVSPSGASCRRSPARRCRCATYIGGPPASWRSPWLAARWTSCRSLVDKSL